MAGEPFVPFEPPITLDVTPGKLTWPKYVYILSDYHEYGADHVTATLDRNELIAMVAANWPPNDGDPLEREERRWRGWITDAQAGLERLLIQSDEDLARETGGHSCQDGWGGVQLHVVRLV